MKSGSSSLAPMCSQQMRQAAQSILESLHVQIDVDLPVKKLKLAQKQIVEIARTLYLNTQVIIMDEPTAALEEGEREQLFALINHLKKEGHSIIFISHHLDELVRICDTVAILRDGDMVACSPVENITTQKIVELMIGKPLESQYPKLKVPLEDEILSVHGLNHSDIYHDINFSLRRGEVLGIVGVEGCGKNEVIQTIFGRLPGYRGEIKLRGEPVEIHDIRDAMRNKIAYVPAERKTDGLFPIQSVAWNTTIASVKKIQRGLMLSSHKEVEQTNDYIQRLSIKCRDCSQTVGALSGGNQQKIMLARWIMTDADIFLLEEPTRGIDVNAKTEVYAAIGKCVQQGKGVIVVSSEEEEVLGICDKILVMNKGYICAVLDAQETSVKEIKSYAVK